MRELTFQATIAGCSIQDFHQIACSDSKAITQFHRDVNKDETVIASGWSSDGTRTVEFTLAMSIPASVQRFVGAGPIRVKDRQGLTWPDEHTIKIESVPELQISYAKALKTMATLLISETSQGVSIDVAVKVNAAVPWPMQGTVEALMADQAKKTVGQYVEYIGGYVEAALEEMNNQRKMQQEQQQLVAAAAPSEQQQQQQQQVVPPLTPVEAPAAPAVPIPTAPIPPPAAAAAAAAVTALVPAPAAALQLPPAAAAAEVPDVFFDASEVLPGSTLELLLRELREAKQARLEANRLLASIKESVQHLDQAVSRELAFQEGVRYAQTMSSGSSSYLYLTVAAAAAASTTAAYLLLRRNALK